MDIGVLSKFNPWWSKGAVPPQLLGAHEREVLLDAKKCLDKRFIVLLYGLRRVGKSTMLYQIINSLLVGGAKPENILYFSFDEKAAGIGEVISAYEEMALKKRIPDAGKVFIFLDEVQKADDWQGKIKVLYDLNPQLKIFLSGSASISLQKKSSESLAGRIVDIHVKPLSFSEFAEWKGVKLDASRPEISQREATPLLMDYLRKGGFPEIVGEESDDAIRSYLKNTVLERVVLQDLPQEFGLKDVQLLKTLLEMFCHGPGMIVNVEGISRDLGRNKITVGNYIEHLKYALLILEVKNFRSSMIVSSRKNKKIYPASTAFCFAYRDDFFSDAALQKIAESAVATHLQARNYYSNGFEVDFVERAGSDIFPVEVKYGERDEGQLKKFMSEFKAKKGVLVSRDIVSSERMGIRIAPLWLFLHEKTEWTGQSQSEARDKNRDANGGAASGAERRSRPAAK